MSTNRHSKQWPITAPQSFAVYKSRLLFVEWQRRAIRDSEIWQSDHNCCS